MQKKKYLNKPVLAIAGIAVILLFLFVRIFLYIIAVVDGQSMYPTLSEKNILIVCKYHYYPVQSDVVLIRFPTNSIWKNYIVKRVIALEGETVTIDYVDNSVSVNGRELEEPYINYDEDDPMKLKSGNAIVRFVVPTGYVFVLGDNRNNSSDSRDEDIGMIAKSDIIGNVIGVFGP